jgi:hypothetical protein
VIALTGALALVMAGAAPAPSTDPNPPQTRLQAAPPPARPLQEPLRGSGILIIDRRDREEDVKARLRLFVQEARARLPPEWRQEETRRQIDALLASDLPDPSHVPQLSFFLAPDVTADRVRGYIDNTPSARDSRRVCPAACPLRQMFANGFHIHLTRPAGGAGDSILAVEFAGAFSPPSDAVAEAARLEEARHRQLNLLERYPEMGYERQPAGHLFGARVYLGEPLTPEEAQPPPK